MIKLFSGKIFSLIFLTTLFFGTAFSQPERRQVRTVTIPITILSNTELKEKRPQEFLEAGDLIVKENGDQQVILSRRDVSNTPMYLAILIQEDLSSTFNLELKGLADFIRRLPRGSRVMVAYLRNGGTQIRQKFTEDLEKASQSLRIVAPNLGGTANDPYQGVSDVLQRFDALPNGRRAILLISDGLDISNGTDSISILNSISLEQAILKAQRKSVAVYSFFSEATLTGNGNSSLAFNAQGALEKLSNETGGRAFFQGTRSPVSFDPFFADLTLALGRQFALTYLSTHMKKGYYKIQVTSTNPQIKIEHPKGYYYR